MLIPSTPRPKPFLQLVALVSLCCCPDIAAAQTEDSESALSLREQLVLVLVLTGLSAIFAGLTLGVMGLDTLTLEIVASAGREPDASYAATILPVRKLGHQTLCTLVLGNMACNVMIAQFGSSFDPEGGGSDSSGNFAAIISFLLSTFIILIFTEILPMSVCKSKHALMIAAKGIPILKLFMILLYPFAKPLGWALDKMLHHDPGQIYDREELKRLLLVHARAEHASVSGLGDQDELRLMLGAVEFRESIVENIMTPISNVVMLEHDRVIDRTVLEELWLSGHSRVPVFRRPVAPPTLRPPPPPPLPQRANSRPDQASAGSLTSRASADALASPGSSNGSPASPTLVNNHSLVLGQPTKVDILGIVFVKDLIQLDEERGAKAIELLEMYPHGALHYVRGAQKLNEALQVFQTERAHMCIVKDADDQVVGIVTLEDLVERLIKAPILDEYDQDEEIEADPRFSREVAQEVVARQHRLKSTGNSRVGFHAYVPKWEHVDIETGRVHLPRAVLRACARYLAASIDAFALLDPTQLENLIRASIVFVPVGYSLNADDANDDIVSASMVGGHSHSELTAATSDASFRANLLRQLGKRHRHNHSQSLIKAPQQQRSAGGDAAVTASNMPSLGASVTPAVSSVARPPPPSTALTHIYEAGKPSNEFVLIVSGGLMVTAGAENFSSERRSWTNLGEGCLISGEPFVPRFNAYVSRDSCLVIISSAQFEDARNQRTPSNRTSPALPLIKERAAAIAVASAEAAAAASTQQAASPTRP